VIAGDTPPAFTGGESSTRTGQILVANAEARLAQHRNRQQDCAGDCGRILGAGPDEERLYDGEDDQNIGHHAVVELDRRQRLSQLIVELQRDSLSFFFLG